MSYQSNPHLSDWCYLGMAPLKKLLSQFASRIPSKKTIKILDLGCGKKPYKSLFPRQVTFIGSDILPGPEVDILANNWDLPFKTNSFDYLICTQVLEHTLKVPETIKEIRRVVKPGGLIYISVPFAYPIHGAPNDFYRFSEYGLRYMFRNFKIKMIYPHNGFFSTIIRFINAFLVSLPFGGTLFRPVFLVNNLIALGFDTLFKLLNSVNLSFIKKFTKLYFSLTESYSLIAENNK